MLDLSKHDADEYLRDFCARREAGLPSPQDRANAAFLNADQALALLGESDDCDQAAARSAHERARIAASACAVATRQGDQALAAEFARVAEGEALVLDSFDHAKVDGLRRHEVFA